MTALFARRPEGLIITTVIAVVAGLAFPAFRKIGSGWFTSAGFAALVGLLVVIGLAILNRALEALDRDSRKRPGGKA